MIKMSIFAKGISQRAEGGASLSSPQGLENHSGTPIGNSPLLKVSNNKERLGNRALIMKINALKRWFFIQFRVFVDFNIFVKSYKIIVLL